MKRSHVFAAIFGTALGLAACSGGTGSNILPQSTQGDAIAPHGVARAAATSLPTLGAYNVDWTNVITAGVSSGADMATQVHFSHSSKIKGEATFAGSPFFCALGTSDAFWGLVYGPVYAADYAAYSCSGTSYWPSEAPPLGTLETDTKNAASDGYMDPVSNLNGEHAWLWSGTADTVVSQKVVEDTNTMLNYFGVGTSTNFTTASEHGWVTPDVSSSTNPCGQLNSDYLINCGVDAEGAFLSYFFGTLNARNNGTLTGSLIKFNQSPYAATDMDSSAYIFVPAACASGSLCKLVVALHGCEMGQSFIGTAFVTNSGLNEWADTNKIIVLYPQAIASTDPVNDLGCWDWWGYNGTNYASSEGSQVTAIWKMMQRI
jgi:poly(3-hydroxybutyrate) depolymerase